MAANQDDRSPLLPVRTTLVFLLSVLTGIGAGVLTVSADAPVPYGVLVGAGALAAAVRFFDWLVN
ncbi:hypothetical protein [Kutzneria buriramensis]|uniref:Uncharacterized protein n=1 Tax=Kutzneria buriramensis TaxID=1045776 RepID=A0A3E0I9G1_9PSEU|nr:hypothetical protein [Kutzneria buriramensis]REH55196.1 hypothetical protein BCF44_101213 [Kutzneria buriramensis]